MPTLIRLIIILLFLGGLAFGGMVALTAMVEPTEKEIRVRIPTRDLMQGAEEGRAPDIRDALPAPRITDPEPGSAPAELPSAPAPSTSNQSAPDMTSFE